MRSLIGDRFLKKFAGGILRRLKPTDETVAEPESHENSLLKPGNSENQAVQGEEAPKNIETVDEVTKSFNQKDE